MIMSTCDLHIIFQIIVQQIITQHFGTHPLMLYKITFRTKQSCTDSTPLPAFKSRIHLFMNSSNGLPALKLPANGF